MAFPRKFQALLEIEKEDMPPPKHLWLVWAVCGCSADACGWQGWILEGAFSTSEPTVGPTYLVPGSYESSCPMCHRELFRTAAAYRFDVSSTQIQPLIPGIDYKTTSIEFE
jgi:hypothetical protein